MGCWRGYDDMTGFSGVLGLLLWIFLVLVAVALIKWLFFRTNNHNKAQSWSAMDILNQRFAEGEISEGEYLRMKKRLEEGEISEKEFLRMEKNREEGENNSRPDTPQ